jgi:hypothetical protein
MYNLYRNRHLRYNRAATSASGLAPLALFDAQRLAK